MRRFTAFNTQKCIRKGIIIFKIFFWGSILSDICAEITFYGSVALKLKFRRYISQYTSPNENVEYGYPQNIVQANIVHVFKGFNKLVIILTIDNNWASTRENLSSGVCEQHRRRPACASAQPDQRLCYSRFGKYHI